jgi:alkylation response protein AidB-like acyl-CoA dehydrogenase
VWTTQGHHADYCFLLTRTDPDAKKHAGISYMLVPMRQEGVEVRGITQPDGTAEFCEVFFDNARCPKDAVVGGVNNGWKVANSTLAFERGQSATTGYRRFAEEYRLLVEAHREGRDRRSADPSAADGVLHQDPDPADQRPAQPVGDALGRWRHGHDRARRHQQDVLVRDAQGGDGTRRRHLRRRRAC